MAYIFGTEAEKSELLVRIKDEIFLPAPVKNGDNNKSAKRVQEWLCLHGFNVVIDGAFGNITEITVKAFQDMSGLLMDGVVGPVTFAKLVEPMTKTLRKVEASNLSSSALMTLYAYQHLESHPREIGGENRGPWVRLYMKGKEGREWAWCAGFVSFIMRQAFSHSGEPKPLQDTFSCDRLAENAINKDLFISSADVDRGNIPPGSIFLRRREHGDWTHTGIVVESGADHFRTVEGNTNDDGANAGYEVTSLVRDYAKRDFIVFTPEDASAHVDPAASLPFSGIHVVSNEVTVRRHFFDEAAFETYGSFFSWWGGWISAAHVTEAASQLIPDFATGPLIERPGPDRLDAALIGCTRPARAPKQLKRGQLLEVLGFPAGSGAVARRLGAVHMKRPSGVSWIVRIETPNEPVTSGMSGGLVLDRDTKKPVAIIIERNSKADLDTDPEQDHSLNVVSLRDVWDAMESDPLIA